MAAIPRGMVLTGHQTHHILEILLVDTSSESLAPLELHLAQPALGG